MTRVIKWENITAKQKGSLGFSPEDDYVQLTSVCKTKGPQTKIWCSVGYTSKTVLNSMDSLVDKNLAKIKLKNKNELHVGINHLLKLIVIIIDQIRIHNFWLYFC